MGLRIPGRATDTNHADGARCSFISDIGGDILHPGRHRLCPLPCGGGRNDAGCSPELPGVTVEISVCELLDERPPEPDVACDGSPGVPGASESADDEEGTAIDRDERPGNTHTASAVATMMQIPATAVPTSCGVRKRGESPLCIRSIVWRISSGSGLTLASKSRYNFSNFLDKILISFQKLP